MVFTCFLLCFFFSPGKGKGNQERKTRRLDKDGEAGQFTKSRRAGYNRSILARDHPQKGANHAQDDLCPTGRTMV